MNLEIRIKSLVALGQFLANELNNGGIENVIWQAKAENSWFTQTAISSSLTAISSEFLDETKLRNWVLKYDLSKITQPRKMGVVMAGNIPAVGFHDALCVLISGHKLMAKLSSTDSVLMKFLLNKLIEIEPQWREFITFADKINDADAYIATGSNNTSRYFEYYFSKKPNIIRKNRTSVAVLNGQETNEELLLLGHDILQYFGLGCRNVAKVFVPKNYTFDNLYEAIEPMNDEYRNHHKYFNNYEYNKSIYLVNAEPHFDNGWLIFRESNVMVSPISVVFFENYENEEDLAKKIETNAEQIQCVVSKNAWYKNSFAFGQAQCPTLTDYADGVDTMTFLSSI